MNETRACWYMMYEKSYVSGYGESRVPKWHPGKFHAWGLDPGEEPAGSYSVAIIEGRNGRCLTVLPCHVSFASIPPTGD